MFTFSRPTQNNQICITDREGTQKRRIFLFLVSDLLRLSMFWPRVKSLTTYSGREFGFDCTIHHNATWDKKYRQVYYVFLKSLHPQPSARYSLRPQTTITRSFLIHSILRGGNWCNRTNQHCWIVYSWLWHYNYSELHHTSH